MSDDGKLEERYWVDFLNRERKSFGLYLHAISHQYVIEMVRSVVGDGESILEVGCGSGLTSVLLADMGYKVIAIDISEQLVRGLLRYREVYQNLQAIQGNMFNLQFADDSFSVAFSCGVLEHFSDDEIVAALKEQARVAQYVLIDVPNSRCKVRPFGNERLLATWYWRRLINSASLRVVSERGRDVIWWKKLLPGLVFHPKSNHLTKFLGITSIFLCTSQC